MRSLKDWYVQFESVKMTNKTYYNYLLSSKRHPGQRISQLTKNTMPYLDADLQLYNDVKTGRGNRPQKNGYAIHISLPFELEDEEWKELYEESLSKMWDEKLQEMEISENNRKVIIKKLMSRVFAVTHKKDHVHLNIPTIFFDEKLQLILKVSQKKWAYKMKQNVNEWLERKKDVSKHTYMLQEAEKQSKKSQKQAKIDRDDKIVSELDNELIRISSEIDKLIERARLIEDEKEREYVNKSIKTAQKQLSNANTRRAQSTIDKVEKSLKNPTPSSNLFK